jgi:hypothetical protein
MPIKGFTKTAKLSVNERGKPIPLGRLNKGERTGWGTSARFEDYDYFRFTPYDSDQKTADRMMAIFNEVYGMEPKKLRDIRIPVDIAGNFDIHESYWLYAHKYGKDKTPVFMGRSDGENIKQLRDPANPRSVGFHYDGERLHQEWSTDDKSEYGALVWNGKEYPWQQHLKIGIILTEFNEALHREKISGHGVVTLQTTSRWDIANLVGEYEAAITELADLFHNPLQVGSYERMRNSIPLRSIPLELFRSYDTYTTPPYATKNNPNPSPDSRYEKSSWLLHWRINQEFTAAMHKAQQAKTANLLTAIETMPLLSSGDYVARANNDLFGDDDPAPAVPPGKQELVELDGFYEDELQTEWIEDEEPTDDYNWKAEAVKAETLEAWAMAAYQVETVKVMTPNAVSLKSWRKSITPEFTAQDNGRLLKILEDYCNARADGTPRKEALSRAIEQYSQPSEAVQGTLLDGGKKGAF